MLDVTLYTVPHCADCEVIKWLLRRQGVPFTEKGSGKLNRVGC